MAGLISLQFHTFVTHVLHGRTVHFSLCVITPIMFFHLIGLDCCIFLPFVCLLTTEDEVGFLSPLVIGNSDSWYDEVPNKKNFIASSPFTFPLV